MAELHFAARAAAVELAVDHEPRADAAAGIRIDDDPGAPASADERLAERRGIGVILEDHRHRAEAVADLFGDPSRQGKIAPAPNMKTRRHHPLLPVHRATEADADGADDEPVAGRVIDDASDLSREDGADPLGPSGRVDAVGAAEEDTAIGSDDRRLELRAADLDAERRRHEPFNAAHGFQFLFRPRDLERHGATKIGATHLAAASATSAGAPPNRVTESAAPAPFAAAETTPGTSASPASHSGRGEPAARAPGRSRYFPAPGRKSGER
jgi:hypothetical protein